MHDDLKMVLLPLLIVFALNVPPLKQPVHAHETTQPAIKQSINPDRAATPIYGYRIVNSYPHDPDAFTQGLIFHNGRFYEGTGLHGASSLRQVELETGKVLQRRDLPEKYFGEGIALCGNRLFQLTYQSEVGFIYNLDLQPAGSFHYKMEGWGLTCDGSHLILSDGTAALRWLDAETFKLVKKRTITDQGRPVDRLNELEFVQGEIFANIWKTNLVARISPDTGQVMGWIDLEGLSRLARSSTIADTSTGFKSFPSSGVPDAAIDVLNGIAYDAQRNRLFVTGKFWPKLFEIQLIKK